MYEKGDYERLQKIRIEIEKLERHLQISWQKPMGDYGRLNTLKMQEREQLKKMNGRKYNKEILSIK